MPLPLPNLDDKTFAILVEEATSLIPSRAPAWTDHNRHDPGITLIELFAWLTEMQQFYLNCIPPANYLKYLKLLGSPPHEATSACADVTFALGAAATDPVFVPQGTPLQAGDVVFETDAALHVIPVALTKVLSSLRAGVQDHTETNRLEGLTFTAFGEEAEVGSRLYLGFDAAFPALLSVSLTFNLFDAYPVATGRHGTESVEVVPSAYITWEYYHDTSVWVPLDAQYDGTLMLSQSGRLVFSAPENMRRRVIQPLPDNLFWIRATVREAGYELPPRLDTILLNTTAVREQETLGEVTTFSSLGEANQTYTATTYLARHGDHLVQVREADGYWRDWEAQADFSASGPEDRHYTIEVSETGPGLTLSFGNGEQGQIPLAGDHHIRLMSYLPAFEAQRQLGRSNGLPHQRFTLERPSVIGVSLFVQVAEPEPLLPGSERRWRDWVRIADFDASAPGDPHYTLHAESGEIRFGNGVNGDIPHAPADLEGDNIRVLAYRVGGGEGGNVAAETITYIVLPESGAAGLERLTVCNRRAASGGAPAETLEAAQLRARSALKTPSRAITTDDYVALALATPGLRVARAMAIPLFAPGSRGYPDTKTPATVTVVIVPYSLSRQPTPSEGFLQTVCRHLDRHRLITTQLHVMGPDYVRVQVQAEVVLRPGFQPGDSRDRIASALNAFLHPLEGGPDGTGWPFGRTVYKSEIYQQIEQVDGVDCVHSLRLSGAGAGIQPSAEGNIAIPPYSLVFAGEHRIETSEPRSRVPR
jgi:hypothetical protein